MRLAVVFALPALLLAGRTAEANQCPALMHHVVTPEIPVGCPLVVFKDHEWTPGLPTATLARGETYTQITPTLIASETKNLDIYMETIDQDCIEFHGYVSRPWDRVTLDVGDVEVGDVLNLHSGGSATIIAAGECPTPGLPTEGLLYCQSPVQDYWACEHEQYPCGYEDEPLHEGDDTVGCNAGRGSSLGLAALGVLLGYRRRRATSRR
jgi:hypothetical protein